MPDEPVLVEVDGGVATITLNRPDVRNAISTRLLTRLREVMAGIDADDTVDAAVLTGADPAFCAGLDLRELRDEGSELHTAVSSGTSGGAPWEPIGKPLIAAVNGAAITGGLEFALNCDVVVASDRAAFADTHARVGVLPGWGLTVLLPLAVGRSRARQMSLTGEPVSAGDALTAGLVSEVVPHERMLARAQEIGAAMAGLDRRAVRTLLASYRRAEAEFVSGGYKVEAETARRWNAGGLDRTTFGQLK
ncbi:enoyl-CoA hydratase [Actinomadura sp. KC345]|uniref:enoyl-CoA hydratase n=1 Tax=Actinomadura sp. KC345 TaxID=2530371 RepID=UPI00104F5BD1|nr:enoyl-CoA hydratase [Actinomadura sp. KC345]TDC44790.1 enoyl-CoA hydratase [Actinomadura sp. KC345]